MRPCEIFRGLTRYHRVSRGLIRSHVLFLIEYPGFEIIAMKVIGLSLAGRDQDALNRGVTSFVPRLGPPLQRALTNREVLLGCDSKCLLDGDGVLLSNLNWVPAEPREIRSGLPPASPPALGVTSSAGGVSRYQQVFPTEENGKSLGRAPDGTGYDEPRIGQKRILDKKRLRSIERSDNVSVQIMLRLSP